MQAITNEPFLKHLNVQKTPHVIVTAEDPEFDDIFLEDLRDEGFHVVYLAQEDSKPNAFADKVHALANQITGVSERYGIVGPWIFHFCFLFYHSAFILSSYARKRGIPVRESGVVKHTPFRLQHKALSFRLLSSICKPTPISLHPI